MLTFIVNPAAGNGAALKTETRLKAELERRSVAANFVHTDAPGHATQLAREAAAKEGCKGVIAVGGDGTCYEVACGLMGAQTPMGIIPAGTGNDFIKSVGIPKKPMQALELILRGKARPVDVGRMNSPYFSFNVLTDNPLTRDTYATSCASKLRMMKSLRRSNVSRSEKPPRSNAFRTQIGI